MRKLTSNLFLLFNEFLILYCKFPMDYAEYADVDSYFRLQIFLKNAHLYKAHSLTLKDLTLSLLKGQN